MNESLDYWKERARAVEERNRQLEQILRAQQDEVEAARRVVIAARLARDNPLGLNDPNAREKIVDELIRYNDRVRGTPMAE